MLYKLKIMTNSYSINDYRDMYFEYKDIDKIYGQPYINSLLRIFRQLKRNTQHVPNIMGGE